MGTHPNISYDSYPIQSEYVGQRATVIFHYHIGKIVEGEVVRDDREAPWVTLIRLDDGRIVRAEECQYNVPRVKSRSRKQG